MKIKHVPVYSHMSFLRILWRVISGRSQYAKVHQTVARVYRATSCA